MAPKRTLRIDQGATFKLVLYWRAPLINLVTRDLIRDENENVIPGPPLDLTGYTARMQLRKTAKDTTALLSLTSSPPAGITVYSPSVTIHPWVRAASVAPVTLTGPQTVDGVSCVAGDRVLVKDQASSSADGIYVVAAGAWTRATDADAAGELTSGATVWVYEGTANSDTVWRQTGTLMALSDPQSWEERTDVARIDIVATDEQTAGLVASGVYDIELESAGGEVTRLMEGKYRLSAEVTR